MIRVCINTDVVRREKIATLQSTPLEIFEELGIDAAVRHICLNGGTIAGDELNHTFEDHNIADGDTVYLSSVVKANGGCA